jgi:hypothetical protein
MNMLYMLCCLAAQSPGERADELQRVAVTALNSIAGVLRRLQASGVQNEVLDRHRQCNGGAQTDEEYFLGPIEILAYGSVKGVAGSNYRRYGSATVLEGMERMEAYSAVQQAHHRDHTFRGESQILHWDSLDCMKYECKR